MPVTERILKFLMNWAIEDRLPVEEAMVAVNGRSTQFAQRAVINERHLLSMSFQNFR